MLLKIFAFSIFLFIKIVFSSENSSLFKIEEFDKKSKLSQNQTYDTYSIVKDTVNLNAPSKLSNCKAKLDDGSIIDLTSLDDVNNPKYSQ